MPDPGTFDTQAAGAPDALAVGFIKIRGLRAIPCDVTYSVGEGAYLVLWLEGREPRKPGWGCWVGMYKTHRAGSPFQKDLARFLDLKKAGASGVKPMDPPALALDVPQGWRHEAFKRGDRIIHTYVGPERAAIVRYMLEGKGVATFPRFKEINRLLEWAPRDWVVQKQHIEVGPTDVEDAPLPSAVRKEVESAVARARASLKLPDGASPADVQEAVHEAVDGVLAAKKRPAKSALEDLAIDLGSLWGQAVCDALGWEWRRLEVEGDEVYAVANADRSHYVAPMPYLQRQLTQRGAAADNTTLLLFNMLKAGKRSLPPSPERGYKQLG